MPWSVWLMCTCHVLASSAILPWNWYFLIPPSIHIIFVPILRWLHIIWQPINYKAIFRVYNNDAKKYILSLGPSVNDLWEKLKLADELYRVCYGFISFLVHTPFKLLIIFEILIPHFIIVQNFNISLFYISHSTGDYLKGRYDKATQVKLSRKRRLKVKKRSARVPTVYDLVYLDPSPNYCVKNESVGVHGMYIF